MSDDPHFNEVRELLSGFIPASKAKNITPSTRLFHDLLIRGDEVAPLWNRLDPRREINMRGFVDDEFFPAELSWDALVVGFLARLGMHSSILQKYKSLTVQDLLELKKGRSWEEIRGSR